MTRLDRLVSSHPVPTWRLLAWSIIALVIGLIVWANFANLGEVAIANGEVVPQGKVKVIQHLEGGIVESIFVREGDVVTEGQPLVQLNLAVSGVNREELQIRLDAQMLQKARLEAEAEGGKPPVFPADVAARRPALANAERRTNLTRMQELESTFGVLQEQARQKELEVNELSAQRRALANNIKTTEKRYELVSSLLSQKLVPELEHLSLQAELENQRGQLETLDASIPRARAGITEAKQRLAEAQIRFRREAQQELTKAEEAIGRIKELLSEATGQKLRSEVKSPIEGVVKNMRYNTIGGVVKPGEAIMEIVPTGDRLVIDAKLSPVDRGYVTVGQRAIAKISTYDFSRYGGLKGEVILVGSDSNTDESGNTYFKVVVQTDKTYLGVKEGTLPITPGMQATVEVHTGTKTVMDYLIKPVLSLRDEAFRER